MSGGRKDASDVPVLMATTSPWQHHVRPISLPTVLWPTQIQCSGGLLGAGRPHNCALEDRFSFEPQLGKCTTRIRVVHSVADVDRRVSVPLPRSEWPEVQILSRKLTNYFDKIRGFPLENPSTTPPGIVVARRW